MRCTSLHHTPNHTFSQRKNIHNLPQLPEGYIPENRMLFEGGSMGKRVLGHPKIYLLPLHNFQRTRNTPHPPASSCWTRPTIFFWHGASGDTGAISRNPAEPQVEEFLLLFPCGGGSLALLFFVYYEWETDGVCGVSHARITQVACVTAATDRVPPRVNDHFLCWCRYSSRAALRGNRN